jgi:hypothetical protein
MHRHFKIVENHAFFREQTISIHKQPLEPPSSLGRKQMSPLMSSCLYFDEGAKPEPREN